MGAANMRSEVENRAAILCDGSKGASKVYKSACMVLLVGVVLVRALCEIASAAQSSVPRLIRMNNFALQKHLHTKEEST